MFQTIVIVSVLFTGIQKAGGYPAPPSIVDPLNVGEPSYRNADGSPDVANKVQGNRLHSVSTTKTADAITFRVLQKSTVSSALNPGLKMSKNLLLSPMITALIPRSKIPASAKISDWRNVELDDGESVTRALPEETTQTTTESVTTSVTTDNLTTVDDTVDTASRTRRVPRKHYGETDERRWFSIELATKADWKSPSPKPEENVECSCSHRSYYVNKLQPDIRLRGQRCQTAKKNNKTCDTWSGDRTEKALMARCRRRRLHQ